MTREEAITVLKAFMENPLFSDAHKQTFNIAIHDIKQRHDWDINKLMLVPKTEWEQEPTTKNDKIDCQRTDCNNCVNHKYCDYEPTTKKDLGVDCIVDVLGSYTDLDIPYKREIAENILTKLSSVTPANKEYDDCISRADAIQTMQDKAKKLSNEDTINGLCGAVAILFDLPPVTPIRPKGHWITRPHVYGVTYCSKCDFELKIDDTNYCPNCGADMREVEE